MNPNGHGNAKPNGHANGHDAGSMVMWPAPIAREGFNGLAGEFADMVATETEGDKNVILLAFLVYAGNLMGRNHYMRTGADRQHPNLYLCPVGTTGTGRKGSGVSAAKTFFTDGDLAPHPHVTQGISSGEGIMWLVRDPKTKREWNRKDQVWEELPIDEGVKDKRLLISLGEFQQCLAVMRRPDSILSSVMRQAWDHGNIASPSKNNEVSVKDAHISLIGCISKDELKAETSDMDAQNGTLNRFLFACSLRSRLLPEGGNFDDLTTRPEFISWQKEFNKNTAYPAGKPPTRMQRDDVAQDLWGRNGIDGGLYKVLSQPRIGPWGTVTARGAQQVIRLSIIFAILNGHSKIMDEDQVAACEVWRFCDDSARYIWGGYDLRFNQLSMRILEMLRESGSAGLNRSTIHGAIKKRSSEDILHCLRSLNETGLIYWANDADTGGRPAERWFATL